MSLLIYRHMYKAPRFWMRIIFEYVVYRAVFRRALWTSSLLFKAARLKDDIFPFKGVDHDLDETEVIEFYTEVFYEALAQFISDQAIANRSPWECIHTAYQKFLIIVAMFSTYILQLFSLIYFV
jgi:hypothetical protein